MSRVATHDQAEAILDQEASWRELVAFVRRSPAVVADLAGHLKEAATHPLEHSQGLTHGGAATIFLLALVALDEAILRANAGG